MTSLCARTPLLEESHVRHDRRCPPRIPRNARPSTPALDVVHERVLGALRVLRHALGAHALHRRSVFFAAIRRDRATRAARTARIWRSSTRPSIGGGFVADRLLGYQRSILLGAVIMGAGPLHDHGAESAGLRLRPRAGDHRQWPVQAEHLVDGRPALRARAIRAATAASRSSTWASTSAGSSRRWSPAGSRA